METKITSAVIGAGKWGKKIIRVANDLTNIKYCCNRRNKEKLQAIKKLYPKIIVTQNLEEILSDKSVSIVFIATPISTHYDVAKLCLRYKKHVFIEKPMADSSKQAKNLNEIAKKYNRLIFVGHLFLFSSNFLKIKKIMKNEEITSISTDWYKYGSFNENIVDNLLSHDISIIEGLTNTGGIKKIKLIDKKGVLSEVDILSLEIQYKNGIKCFFKVNRVFPKKRKTFYILTKSGKIIVWEDDCLFIHDKNEGRFLEYEGIKEEPLVNEVRHFIEYIKRKKEAATNGMFGHKIVTQLEKIKNIVYKKS